MLEADSPKKLWILTEPFALLQKDPNEKSSGLVSLKR